VGLELPAGVDDLKLFLDADRERLLAHRNLPELADSTSMPAKPARNQADSSRGSRASSRGAVVRHLPSGNKGRG
jgi:hypothetical protein